MREMKRVIAGTRGRSKKRAVQIVINLMIILLAFLMLYPIIFMFFTSFKSNPEFFENYWGPPLELVWSNYAQAWDYMKDSFKNTIITCGISVPGALIVGSLSAYAFARLRFPAKNFFYVLVLALLMIPNMLVLIPSFVMISRMGLLDSYWAVSLPAIANSLAFVIFVLRGFFAELPEEIFEAARIDGATELGIYRRVAVPLSLPIMGTVFIMRLLTDWNDYLWPSLVLRSPDKWTIAISIKAYESSFDLLTQYGPLYAGFVVTVIPLVIFFAFTMKYYIEGLTSGAVKG